MKDYLGELCADLKIQLIYIGDDHTALTGGIKEGKPFIKVDNLFKYCPEKVAKAIISYCTEPQHDGAHLKIIKNYIFENVITVNYSIEPPDEKFTSLFIKHVEEEAPPETITPEVKTTQSKTAKPRTSKARATTGKTTKSKTSGSKKAGTGTSSLVEMNISSITKKSFYGVASSMKPDETIKPSADDVIELEIEVENPSK